MFVFSLYTKSNLNQGNAPFNQTGDFIGAECYLKVQLSKMIMKNLNIVAIIIMK